jgi:hypothetical protein
MAILVSDRRTFACSIFLIFSAVIAACSAEGNQTPFAETTIAAQSAAATITPDPSPSPTPTSAPSRTPITTPIGAGPVTPEFKFHLDTPFEKIEPGEYIIVADAEASYEKGYPVFQYVSWDGYSSGPFFYPEAIDQIDIHLTIISGVEGQLWFKVKHPPSLLILDLPAMQTKQILFGKECNSLMGSNYPGSEFFAFECIVPDSISASIIYIVSNENMSIVSGFRYPGNMTMSWRSFDILQFSDPWNVDAQSFRYCIAEAPDWKIECQELPYHAGEISPDGKWVWVAPPGETDADRFREMPLAVLPVKCLNSEGSNCQPIPIMPPVDSEGNHYNFTYPSWSPDSQKLLVVDVECVGGGAQTWAWYYDLQNKSSQDVIQLPDCYLPTFNSIVWSADGKKIAIDGSGFYDQPIVISLEGEPLSYRLPIKGVVVTTVQIP